MARRSKGEGSIYKNKEGLWTGAITLPNGKRRVKRSKIRDGFQDYPFVVFKKVFGGSLSAYHPRDNI
jgi:uncharacterized protein YbdZ (MbtH family)